MKKKKRGKKSLPYFETSYSPKTRGKETGKHFSDLIHEGLEIYCNSDLDTREKKILNNAYKYTKDNFPDLIKEMEGLAKGAQVDPQSIFRLNSFNALHVPVKVPVKACSAIAVPDTRGNVYLGSTLDIDDTQRKFFFTHRMWIKGGEAIILQWAGTLWAHCGVNSYGLACAVTSGPSLPNKSLTGLPQHLGPYLILTRCRDVDSAINLLSGITYIGKGNNIGLVDASGKVAMVEKSSDRMAVSMGNSVTMYRTNHFMSEEMRKFNRGMFYENSVERIKRLNKLLQKYSFKNAYNKIHSVLRSHGTGGICQHNKSGLDTLAAGVINPKKRWIELCPEKPCRYGFKRYKLKEKD